MCIDLKNYISFGYLVEWQRIMYMDNGMEGKTFYYGILYPRVKNFYLHRRFEIFSVALLNDEQHEKFHYMDIYLLCICFQ